MHALFPIGPISSSLINCYMLWLVRIPYWLYGFNHNPGYVRRMSAFRGAVFLCIHKI
jgi:hypothetical protein